MLVAHLEDPWKAPRLVSLVMDRPQDAFAAGSELGAFGERLLDEIDRRLAAVVAFDPAKGAEAGGWAARQVNAAALCIGEIEQAFALSSTGPWGVRINQQKRTLSGLVEPRLKLAEDAVAAAFPLQGGRRGKNIRAHPRLDLPLDPTKVHRAYGLAAFTSGVRTAAPAAGFASLRAQVVERLEGRLHQYVEDLLEVLHEDDVRTGPARALLDGAADLLEILVDGKAANVVRRRAAAA